MSPAPVVMIGTPAYGNQVTVPFAQSLVDGMIQLLNRNVGCGWIPYGGSPLVTWARNQIAAEFLTREPATHLLFVDADIEWRPDDVISLLAHDVPLIGATYSLKDGSGHFALNALPAADLVTGRHPRSVRVEVAGLPTGFMLIKREVFHRLIEAFPESRIRSTSFGEFRDTDSRWRYDFFPSGLHQGGFEPEDFAFCRRWREIGGQVWLDPTIQLTHYGTWGFTGDPMSMFARAEPKGEAA